MRAKIHFMDRSRAFVGMLLMLVVLPAHVGATATTHIWAPSTDVQPYKLWHVTIDMYCSAEQVPGGGHIPTVTNVGLTLGVLPWRKLNVEVGFDHKTGLGLADNYPLYANVKIGIPENAFGSFSPALAIGAFDIGTKKNLTDYNVLYAKAAKSFTIDSVSFGRLSFGYFSGNDTLLVDENGREDNSGIIAAWERTMTEISDKLWLCVEYMGSHSGYGTWNLGGAWKFASNVGVVVGYDIFKNSQLPGTATVQVDIDF